MFNLIISIISIALIAIMAGASVFYGGDAYNKGSTGAASATFVNQAQQIQASYTLFRANEGGTAGSVADLEDKDYLNPAPKLTLTTATDWTIGDAADGADTKKVLFSIAEIKSTSTEGMTAEICDKINNDGAGAVKCATKGDNVIGTLDVSALNLEPTDANYSNDYDADSHAVVFLAL